jgi:hypothetical protein
MDSVPPGLKAVRLRIHPVDIRYRRTILCAV